MINTIGLKTGRKLVSGSDDNLAPGREHASLSDAILVKKPGYYWISSKSEEVEPKEVCGNFTKEFYMGRTFRGVPSIPGSFKNNHDGTFTQLKHHRDAVWEDRISVSLEAAANVNGKSPLSLNIEQFGDMHMHIQIGGNAHHLAQVISVQKTQTMESNLNAIKEATRK